MNCNRDELPTVTVEDCHYYVDGHCVLFDVNCLDVSSDDCELE